jgi:hypothetical protein
MTPLTPGVTLPDRRFFCELVQHGLSGILTVRSSLPVSVVEARDDLELAHLDNSQLRIHRSIDGVRIWDIVPSADASYSVQFGISAPARIDMTGNGSATNLSLGSLFVNGRVLGESGTLRAINAYTGNTRIARFANLNRRQLTRTDELRVENMGRLREGLVIEISLGTPLGFGSSFEIRSVGATLVVDLRPVVG